MAGVELVLHPPHQRQRRDRPPQIDLAAHLLRRVADDGVTTVPGEDVPQAAQHIGHLVRFE